MNEQIDPNQFVITRKRKKYRFALFANSPICFELEEWKKHAVDVIELGAGTGLFSVELATRHPEKTFLAVDVKADRLQRGAYEAQERGLGNISFVRARADQLGELVPEHSLGSLWLTFPDPFPRERSARRRMTHPYFLEMYEKLLRPDGALFLKHDNPVFFEWSVEQLSSTGWNIEEQTTDLHDSDLPDDYKILTTYEQKWLDNGLTTHFVRATRRSS